MLYRILLGLCIAAAAILVFFFFWGLADGTVSSFNIGLWTAVLLGTAAILWGGLALRRAGQTVFANLVLALLAVPTALYGLFLAVVIFSGERWN